MVRVLIAEDDIPISITLSNSINAHRELQAIAIINDGAQVISKIKELQPDFVILDLGLPNKDGLKILEEINNDNELENIKVIVYSGEFERIQKAVKYDNVVRFLQKCQTSIEDVSLEIKNIAECVESRNLSDEVLEKLVRMVFQTKCKGTKLLRDCIVFSINDNKENMNEVYKIIACIRKESELTVKSNIRVAVNKMWRNANHEHVRKYLRLGETDKPSSKDVAMMVKYYVERAI